MPPAIVDWLADHLEKVDATLFLDEMAVLIDGEFKQKFCPKLICATLLRRGMTRKKLTMIQERRSEFERSAFDELISTFLPHQLVAIDETRKDPRTLRRRYGRAHRGKRAFLKCPFSRHATGWSALGIMTCDGMIDVHLSKAKGVNAETFLEAVFTTLLPHDPASFSSPVSSSLLLDSSPLLRLLQPFPAARSVVVLDNATVHWAPELKALVASRGARLVYLPAYSYDKMPIEKAFSKAKAKMQRWGGSASPIDRRFVQEWPEQALRDALLSVTASDARGYFASCGWPTPTELVPGTGLYF